MDDIFVGQLMSSPVATVAPETPIHEAAQTMLDQEIGSLIIVNEVDHPQGILTSTDCVRLVADRRSVDETVVAVYMSEVSTSTTVDIPIHEAADVMMGSSIHHLPVIDDTDRVVGILTTTDLTAYLSGDWTPGPS